MPDGEFNERTVALDVKAADWREAIAAAGQLLVAEGVITPGYVSAMVKAVEIKGPYIVIGPGVALPHASPADGAQRVGLSMVRLAEPIVFGHAQNDPVDLLFCLCSPDFSSHVGLLVGLTVLLENAGGLSELRSAPDVPTAVQHLQALLG